MNLKHKALFITFCLFLLTMGIFISAQKPVTYEYSSSEIEVFKKIASHSIKMAFKTTQNLDEAAILMGVEPQELQKLCLALDIDISFVSTKIAPVSIKSMNKLASDDIDIDIVLNYNGTTP